MSSTNTAILVVGNTRRAEFRQLRAELDRRGTVVGCDDVIEALKRLDDGAFMPEVIVVAQSYPGEITATAIDRLRTPAPLARVVGLLGAWCEGEARTGYPWPGVIRVYWHQWTARCEQELARLADGSFSAWALPATASEEEHLLTAAQSARPQRKGRIVVHAAQFDMADWLVDACESRGYTARWVRPGAAAMDGVCPTAAIFNHQEGPGGDFDSLARFCAEVAPAPVVVLMDFPRPRDRDQALAAGARAMVSKPLLVDDLFWRIDQVSQ